MFSGQQTSTQTLQRRRKKRCGVCMKWPPLSLEIGFDAEYTEIISNKHNTGGSLGKEKVI